MAKPFKNSRGFWERIGMIDLLAWPWRILLWPIAPLVPAVEWLARVIIGSRPDDAGSHRGD